MVTTVMNLDETFEHIIRTDIKSNCVPCLLGNPGIGKSSFLKTLAKNTDTQCFVVTVNQMADKADLTGSRHKTVQKLDNDATLQYNIALINDVAAVSNITLTSTADEIANAVNDPAMNTYTAAVQQTLKDMLAFRRAYPTGDLMKLIDFATSNFKETTKFMKILEKEEYAQVFFPNKTILDAINYAEEHPRELPILFLDEFNRTTVDILSATLSLTTERAIGNYKLPQNLRIVIAGNDKGNVQMPDDASNSRYSIYNVKADATTYLKLPENATLNPHIRSVLTKHPDLIECRQLDIFSNMDDDDDDDKKNESLSIDDIITDGDGMTQITAPRTISYLSNWLNAEDPAFILQLLATPTKLGEMDSNMLMGVIASKVGYTNFAVLLEQEIRENLQNTNVQQQSAAPREPDCYRTLKSQTDMNGLTTTVAGLNPSELSAALVYAIYERQDNSTLLNALTRQITRIMPEDMSKLMSLVANDDYDHQNWDVVAQTASPIGQILNMYSA